MPTVVEGPSIAVRYESWDEWRAVVREAAARRAEPVAPVPTEFCGLCWGAGRVLVPAGNGEGLVPRACAWCDGRGRLPAVPLDGGHPGERRAGGRDGPPDPADRGRAPARIAQRPRRGPARAP